MKGVLIHVVLLLVLVLFAPFSQAACVGSEQVPRIIDEAAIYLSSLEKKRLDALPQTLQKEFAGAFVELASEAKQDTSIAQRLSEHTSRLLILHEELKVVATKELARVYLRAGINPKLAEGVGISQDLAERIRREAFTEQGAAAVLREAYRVANFEALAPKDQRQDPEVLVGAILDAIRLRPVLLKKIETGYTLSNRDRDAAYNLIRGVVDLHVPNVRRAANALPKDAAFVGTMLPDQRLRFAFQTDRSAYAMELDFLTVPQDRSTYKGDPKLYKGETNFVETYIAAVDRAYSSLPDSLPILYAGKQQGDAFTLTHYYDPRTLRFEAAPQTRDAAQQLVQDLRAHIKQEQESLRTLLTPQAPIATNPEAVFKNIDALKTEKFYDIAAQGERVTALDAEGRKLELIAIQVGVAQDGTIRLLSRDAVPLPNEVTFVIRVDPKTNLLDLPTPLADTRLNEYVNKAIQSHNEIDGGRNIAEILIKKPSVPTPPELPVIVDFSPKVEIKAAEPARAERLLSDLKRIFEERIVVLRPDEREPVAIYLDKQGNIVGRDPTDPGVAARIDVVLTRDGIARVYGKTEPGFKTALEDLANAAYRFNKGISAQVAPLLPRQFPLVAGLRSVAAAGGQIRIRIVSKRGNVYDGSLIRVQEGKNPSLVFMQDVVVGGVSGVREAFSPIERIDRVIVEGTARIEGSHTIVTLPSSREARFVSDPKIQVASSIRQAPMQVPPTTNVQVRNPQGIIEEGIIAQGAEGKAEVQTPTGAIAYGTERGLTKQNNEDAVAVQVTPQGLRIGVGDGVGGHDGGELASAIFATHMRSTPLEVPLIEAARRADVQIKLLPAPSTSRPGTTAVAVDIVGNVVTGFHSGDARLYVFDQDGNVIAITKDHSQVQGVIDALRTTDPDADKFLPRKNVIDGGLGFKDPIRPDSHEFVDGATALLTNEGRVLRAGPSITRVTLSPNDVVLLTSDGLGDYVRHPDIVRIIKEGGSAAQLRDRLIQAALDGGGGDNIGLAVYKHEPPAIQTPPSPAVIQRAIEPSLADILGREADDAGSIARVHRTQVEGVDIAIKSPIRDIHGRPLDERLLEYNKANLEAEIRQNQKLSAFIAEHPEFAAQIPRFFGEVRDADGTPHLLFEYVTNAVTLNRLPEELASISSPSQAQDLLRLVETLNRAGIKHTDITLGNLLVVTEDGAGRRRGDIVLIDFQSEIPGSDDVTDVQNILRKRGFDVNHLRQTIDLVVGDHTLHISQEHTDQVIPVNELMVALGDPAQAPQAMTRINEVMDQVRSGEGAAQRMPQGEAQLILGPEGGLFRTPQTMLADQLNRLQEVLVKEYDATSGFCRSASPAGCAFRVYTRIDISNPIDPALASAHNSLKSLTDTSVSTRNHNVGGYRLSEARFVELLQKHLYRAGYPEKSKLDTDRFMARIPDPRDPRRLREVRLFAPQPTNLFETPANRDIIARSALEALQTAAKKFDEKNVAARTPAVVVQTIPFPDVGDVTVEWTFTYDVVSGVRQIVEIFPLPKRLSAQGKSYELLNLHKPYG